MDEDILLEDFLMQEILEEGILDPDMSKINKIAWESPDEASQIYFFQKERKDYQNQGRFLS